MAKAPAKNATEKKPDPAPAAETAEAPTKKKTGTPEWGLPETDNKGVQLASDGLPRAAILRAPALVEAGKAEDELGICSKDQIATAKAKAKAAQEEAEAAEKGTAE